MSREVRNLGIVLLMAGSLASAEANAQSHGYGAPADATTFTITAADGVPEVPFDLINNHLVLPLSVNGSEPLAVVLDTGMPAAGLALYAGDLTRQLPISFDPSIAARVGGAGGEGHRLTAQVAMSESLSLPGLRLDQARILMLPEMPGFTAYHQGILGYSLFGRFVVEIDYDRRLLRLHEPSEYVPPEGAIVLPLELRNNLPYVSVRVSADGVQWFEAQVVVDLGASHAVSLNSDASKRIVVPESAIATVLGHGLSGEIEGHIGRIAGLDLGGAVLQDVLTSFPMGGHQNPRGVDSLDGNLGSDVLKRFNTTFDYAGGRMILVPNESFETPFRFDRSGLRLSYSGEPRVEQILAGSPAEEQGLRVDDLLTHVNGEAVSGKEMHLVRQRLREDGEVRLSFLRNGESLERTLTLRRLI